MENFIAYNPVKLHFGRNVLTLLGKAVSEFGKRVLVVYGKGSVMKNGSYYQVMDQLKTINAEIYEFNGIKSNPVNTDVDKAAEVVRQNNIDVIIALGGGSVIDSSKIIALAASNNCTSWEIMKGKIRPKTAIPVITVLTLAATGTEMNPYAVLQNHVTDEKIGYGHPLAFPKYSFLDPTFTFSVSKEYTAFGIVDLIAHALEAFFAEGTAPLSDRFVVSIIKEAIELASKIMTEPENYELRARMMWASTCALNGITSYGRKTSGDWGLHDVGHTLSMLYDLPHGASLSIAYPAWLKLQKGNIPQRLSELGTMLFDSPDIDSMISKFKEFFILIGSPVSLRQSKIPESEKENIVRLLIKNNVNGYHIKFSENDCRNLTDLMYI